MPDRVMTRLPLQPLMDKAGCITARQLGDIVGLTREAVQRLKGTGVPIARADKLAMLCGFHPHEIWGNDFWDLPEYQDSTVAA